MFSRQKQQVEDAFIGTDVRSLRRDETAPAAPAAATPAPTPMMAPSAAPRPSASAMPSLFSSDLKVTGSIMTDGEVELNGPVDGVVYAKRVTIGATGDFKGDVVAEFAVIDGPATGRITARHVHLRSKARFNGDLIHQKLVIDEGAEFEGAVHRKVDETAWTDITKTFDEPGVELTDDAAKAVEALKREFLKG